MTYRAAPGSCRLSRWVSARVTKSGCAFRVLSAIRAEHARGPWRRAA